MTKVTVEQLARSQNDMWHAMAGKLRRYVASAERGAPDRSLKAEMYQIVRVASDETGKLIPAEREEDADQDERRESAGAVQYSNY